jgi:GNAT superfamily N-acetyltransferase
VIGVPAPRLNPATNATLPRPSHLEVVKPEPLVSRIAGPDDVDLVARTVTLAFADDPVWGPAMAADRTTVEQRQHLWAFLVAGAVRYPWSRVLEGGAATSIWIPPDGTELDERQEAGLEFALMEALGATGAAEFAALIERFEANHRRDVPHAYLSLLATHPDRRGHGLGMGLLADDLQRLDELHLPAWLESTNPANDHRYRSVGFARVGEFRTVDDQRVITTMWRPAR